MPHPGEGSDSMLKKFLPPFFAWRLIAQLSMLVARVEARIVLSFILAFRYCCVLIFLELDSYKKV